MHRAACLVSLLCLAAAGCGTDSQGVDTCRTVEQARCRRAPSCPEMGIGSDQVEECVEFVRDQCLHGLAVADPGAPAAEKCAQAIEDPAATSCAQVAAPESIADCSFLPPSSPADGGSGAADAADDNLQGD